MESWLTDLDNLLKVHNVTSTYRHIQKVVDYTQLSVCAIIFMLASYVLVQTFFLKERRFFAGLISLVIVGSVSGIAVALLMEQFFDVAMDWKTLLSTSKNNPDYLVRLTRSIYWTVGIFFSCFNIAHWVLAIRYWTLALQLQACVMGLRPVNKKILLAVSLTGYAINIVSGLSFTYSFYNFGTHKFRNIAEGLNLIPEFLSMIFLCDALRRFRAIAKGVLKIETTQIFWHVVTFILFVIGSIFLVICVDSGAWDSPQASRTFYALYENIMVVVFISEIPFIWIVFRIQRIEISQKNAEP